VIAAIKGMKNDPWTPWAEVMDIVDAITNSGNYKKRLRLDEGEKEGNNAIINNNTPKSVVKNPYGTDTPRVSTMSKNTQTKSYVSAISQSNGKRTIGSGTIKEPPKSEESVFVNTTTTPTGVSNLDTNPEIIELKKTVTNLEAQMIRMNQMELDIRDVAHGVVNMTDNMTIKNEVLKRSIAADIRVNIEANTMANNDSLIERMSMLMNAQTMSIETRMDNKMHKTDEILANMKETMDKKMDKTTKSLLRMIDTKDETSAKNKNFQIIISCTQRIIG
jgi:hypothetical protein